MEVPTPTPMEMPTAIPTDIPTSTPMEMPTAIPTDIPTSIPEVVQTPTVPNIVITMEPTDVPEPTAYAPLSVDGTRYTVTLHPRGGTLGKNTLSVIQGNPYGTLPIPSRSGYTFEGWFTSMEEGQQPVTKDSLVNLAEDQDLYAKWKANIYTITFDADGGMVDVTSFPVTYGQTYPELPIPRKENALFSGWYTQDGTYVNEYNIFNIASDLTLTAEWQTAFRRADIGPLSFSFENSSVGFSYEDNYRPSLEIYQYIYGNTLKAKKMFTQQSTWSGSCFGMGAAALFFYVGTTDNLQYDDFNASARAINQLEPTDVNQNLNLSLTKLIEVMHVIQHDSYILSKRDKNMNQLDTLCEKVMDSQENKGNPILIYMWGVDDKGNAGGHAVIGYNLVNGLLYIYDPNYPSDASRYITIGKDANGNSTWSYKLNKQYDWGTGQEGAAISFVTYEDLKQGWEQCRMFQYAIGKSGTNSLILSTKNANIYNSNGVLMASIIEGELESKYEDICKIIPNTVVNSQSASSLEIHLPSGEYIIENTDPFSTEFTAEMMNLQQCATVTTQAKKVTVCVNDEERTNFVICHANENQTYSIRLESSIEGDKESIERTGTGNSNHYIGVSQSEGVEKELHYVKNTPISYPITISANEGGTVTCNETAVSSSEQEPLQATYGTNLTFAITPNEGYVISNVFVDDTDMGPVATYMLENITAAHSIRIVFSPKTVDTTKPKIQLTVDQLPSFNYTGKEILPSVTVRSGELILEENIDYIVLYRNNTKVGTAYVDIIGINAYNGLEATTISFKILPAKGKIYTINGLKYKLTDLKGKKVTLTGVSKKTLSSVTIMKEIKIGNTSYKVTTIGAKAFENCKKLKKIVISNTELKAIGKNAFKGISSKAVIKVPASKYKVYTKLLKNKGQSKTVLIKK